MNQGSRKPVRAFMRCAAFGVSLAAVAFSGALAAQTRGGGPGQGMLGAVMGSIKDSTTANQQKLHQYTWTETSTVTVNGRTLPPKVSTASYGPDGKVHKVPVSGGTPMAAQGGRRGPLVQRIVAQKQAEMKDYGQQVARLIALYVPPNPQKMEAAFQAKQVSFEHSGGMVDLVFRNYALKGDSMTVAFDTASRKIHSLHVNSYLDAPQDAVNLDVQFATLPDGTNHPARTTLDATSKGLQVVDVNSDYRKKG